MLANGTKLGFKATKSASTYTNLVGLKEVPDIGSEPELVENTPIAAKQHYYEIGIGSMDDMEYVFIYDNSSADSAYRTLRGYADSNTKIFFCEELPDGTKFEFEGIPAVKVGGGGINDPLDFTLKIAVSSDITVTDPVG